MKNLENYGVQEMNAMEIRNTEGGWVSEVLRGLAYIAAIAAAANDLCGQCITEAIASSDSSLGGSRQFE
ncbi:MAG: hypothetical protein L3J14_01960 [Flavobacteriaceae bacterium]|nr:hypothetical protein [Flavobacteriaceae bacterium]